MTSEILYTDSNVEFERFEDGKYRITFFNYNHWNGDITLDSNKIYEDNITDRESKFI